MLGNKKTTKQKKIININKTKGFAILCKGSAMDRAFVLLPPFCPSLEVFPKASEGLDPQESAPWLPSPHVHLSKLIVFACNGWISQRHFLEWAAVLIFLSLSPLDPKQSRFLFTHKWTLSKFTRNKTDVTGSSSVWEPGEMYTCSVTLLSCSCVAESWDLKLPDCWTKIIIEIKVFRTARC